MPALDARGAESVRRGHAARTITGRFSSLTLRTATPSAASSRSSAFVDVGFGDDERRQQPHDRFGRAVDDDAARQRRRHDRRCIASQSRPQISPAPRTSLITGCLARPSLRRRCSRWRPTRPTARDQAAADQFVQEAKRRAAGQQVAAVGAAVIAERNRVGDVLADERRADRHAAAERLADRDQMRLQAERARSRTDSRSGRGRSAPRRR